MHFFIFNNSLDVKLIISFLFALLINSFGVNYATKNKHFIDIKHTIYDDIRLEDS